MVEQARGRLEQRLVDRYGGGLSVGFPLSVTDTPAGCGPRDDAGPCGPPVLSRCCGRCAAIVVIFLILMIAVPCEVISRGTVL